MSQFRAAVGILAILALAWLLSSHRRRFPIKVVVGGLSLQIALAACVLLTEVGRSIFQQIGTFVTVLISATDYGARFVFGNLVDVNPEQWGMVFAVKALPTIIVFSALSAIGFHLGILQLFVKAMAAVMTRFMGVSGAESLCAAGNVFLGQTEAPLLIRPYIATMTRSELNAIMTAGFATIAGSLMVVYATILGHDDPAATATMARHLLTASLISAPASLVVAKIMLPEVDESETAGHVRLRVERTTANIIDAAATGALDGLKLALNVGAMLIAFLAIIFLIDQGLAQIGRIPGVQPALSAMGITALSLSALLGLLFAPIAWLISIETEEIRAFGSLIGLAMAGNEFIAYQSLATMIQEQSMSPRGQALAVYALCGFANFSSIAIQIAGIGGIAPNRSHDLARLGLRAMLAGAMACWITACVAGIFIPA